MSEPECSKCSGKMHGNGTHRCGCPEWNDGFAEGMKAGRSAALAEGVECWAVVNRDGVPGEPSFSKGRAEETARAGNWLTQAKTYTVRPARLLVLGKEGT